MIAVRWLLLLPGAYAAWWAALLRGVIALELAAQNPDRLAGVGLLDTAVLPAPGVWAGVQPVLARLHALDYRDVVSEFLAQSFFLANE